MTQLEIVTTVERSDLHDQFPDAFRSSWPEFIFHDPVANTYVVAVQERFGAFDVTIVQGELVVAGGWGIALRWDQTIDDLPGGYDDALVRSFSTDDLSTHNTLSVMAIAVHRDFRGRALSSMVITELRRRAHDAGLAHVIAPVRPTLKATYPLTPMATFARWRRGDGEHLDPWIRTHERLGARILAPAPRSMIVTGTVSQWEAWTRMAFPASGAYVVAEALDLVVIDRDNDTGIYIESNLWMQHA
jgi:GNAT superfamily N-acetyltransferase